MASAMQGQVSDWREQMINSAREQASISSASETSRNPLVPHNFFEFRDSGFPSDIVVMALQIPRQSSPAELMQYKDMVNIKRWQHVRWEWISENAGFDGKPYPPGVESLDLGGVLVATVAGHYMMYASREQYEARRRANLEKFSARIAYQLEEWDEQNPETGGRTQSVYKPAPGGMTLDDLLHYEQELGEERSSEGRPLH